MIALRKQLSRFRRGRVSRAKEARKQLRIRQQLERQLFRRLTSLFGRFVNTRAFLYKEFGQYDAGIANRDLQAELIPTLQQHYRRVFTTIYEDANDMRNLQEMKDDIFVFDRSYDLEPLLEEYYATRTLLITGISVGIANRIARIIESGRTSGLTLPQIARNIETQVRGITRSRSATIARTETHNAAGFAAHKYYQQVTSDYGSNIVKTWVATNDLRTRSAHAAANGQQVNMEEDFVIGGALMKHTGDPRGGAKNNINCRCVIIYADDQDIVLE